MESSMALAALSISLGNLKQVLRLHDGVGVKSNAFHLSSCAAECCRAFGSIAQG